mmetsp:Transcript_25201/g.62227  ORF Transcript_25201/g.62227 Transcript_25201/m.62227 type:complete len:218 (-) Transcript_25201:84-737(-)
MVCVMMMASTASGSAAAAACRGSSSSSSSGSRGSSSSRVVAAASNGAARGAQTRAARVGAVQQSLTLRVASAPRSSAVRPLRALEKSKTELQTSGFPAGSPEDDAWLAIKAAGAAETPSAAPAKVKEAEAAAEPAGADLGAQIAALKNGGGQKKAGGDPDNDNMFVGAYEEIGQIEWPTVGAAIKTSGIVVAIVTASTFVLLTVNTVLSEVSTLLFP